MFIMPTNAETFVANTDFQTILGGLPGDYVVVVVAVKCANFINTYRHRQANLDSYSTLGVQISLPTSVK